MATRERIEQRAALTLIQLSVDARVDELLTNYNQQPESSNLHWWLTDPISQRIRLKSFYESVVAGVNIECQRYLPKGTKLKPLFKEAVTLSLMKRGYHIELGERVGYLMVPNEEIGQQVANRQ